MNTPQQQAKLFDRAAATIRLCAPHGIEPKVKHTGAICDLAKCSLKTSFEDYEFPVVVVEGQLVWRGDRLHCKDGTQIIVNSINGDNELIADCSNGSRNAVYTLDFVSWTPPKPKTVMVEMSIERAKVIAGVVVADDLVIACRKALDNLKGG